MGRESIPICYVKSKVGQADNKTYGSATDDDSCSGGLWQDIFVI